MNLENLNEHYSDKDKWPTFLKVVPAPGSIQLNSYEIDCEILDRLSWFKGHFPDQPVLPGVVQLNWANNLAKHLFDIEGFRGVNSLKFTTMILPDTQVTLLLSYNPEKHTVKFNYKSNEALQENSSGTSPEILFSSGLLVYSDRS